MPQARGTSRETYNSMELGHLRVSKLPVASKTGKQTGRPPIALNTGLLRELSAAGLGVKAIAGELQRRYHLCVSHSTIARRLHP